MTEEEWLACREPSRVVAALGQRAWTERRGRLFAVECCRRLRDLPGERLHAVIETAERFADGRAEDTELSEAITTANMAVEWEARHDMTSWQYYAAEVVAAAVAVPVEEYTAVSALVVCAEAEFGVDDDDHTIELQQHKALVDLVRELVGNPFRPVVFDPVWRTSDVMLLAEGAYAEKAFDRLPILADALQDGGCDSDDLLNHLRDPNAAHVRGCWALDLVLGKE